MQLDDGTVIAVAGTLYTAMVAAILALWRSGIKERIECRAELKDLWKALERIAHKAVVRPVSGPHKKVP